MTEADKEARKRLQEIANGDFPEVNISISYEAERRFIDEKDSSLQGSKEKHA